MDVRKLRQFLAVVDQGSMKRAAEVLFIAQPSLSQSIAGLERDLGVRLFRRVGRRLVLTAAGERLIGPARTVLRDLDAATAAVSDVAELRAGRLDLITMPSPGVEPLASLTGEFCRRYPGVTLRVTAAFTAQDVLDAVRRGASEVGLIGTECRIDPPDLRVVPVDRQPMVLVSHPDAPLAARGEVNEEELAQARLIVSRQDSVMRALVDRLLENGVEIRIVAEVDHRTSILPLVMAGAGQAVLPSAWAKTSEQAGASVRMITPQTWLHIALVRRDEHLTPAGRAFADLADERAARVSGSCLFL